MANTLTNLFPDLMDAMNGGGPSKSSAPVKEMARAQFDVLPPTEQMNFLRKEGGKVVD